MELVLTREPLAVGLFLIAHDPFDDGRLRINPDLLGCGLVGAVLADLLLTRRQGVAGEDLVVVAPPPARGPAELADDGRAAGGRPRGGGGAGAPRGGGHPTAAGEPDEIDDYVLDAVATQSELHPVRAWVEPLQDGVYSLVARAAVLSRAVRRQPGTRWLGRGRQPDRFPATDLLAACRPQQALEALLRTPKDLTLAAGTLATLIGVLGIDGLLGPELDRAALRELLAEIEHHLPGDLRLVCDAVRAVSAEVSLRSR